jgi:hypothetical protein
VPNNKQRTRQTRPAGGRRTLAQNPVFSGERKGIGRERGGPSQGLVAWRRFLVESLVCVVLIGVIALAAVRGFGGVLIAPFVVSVAFAIVAIVRYER